MSKKERNYDHIPLLSYKKDEKGVFIWAETDSSTNELLEASLEILGEAKRIAKILDTFVSAVLVGKKVKQNAQELIFHGADNVIIVEDNRLEHFTVVPYTRAVCDVIFQEKPEVLLFVATTIGRSLAPRVATRLKTGLSADCTEFEVGQYANRRANQRFENVLKMIRPSFGESRLATIVGPWAFPQMATARPGVFKKNERDESRKGKVKEVKVEFPENDFLVKFIKETTDEGKEKVDLKGAKILVSGGKGVGSGGFKVLLQFVEQLRNKGYAAELSASRAAVEAGYISSAYQVGQTGLTVQPDVYFAIGISGAIQHIAGMKESKIVVAINKDKDARIFDYANYGIVGEFQDIIPELIQELEKTGKLY
ncbi:MAG: electron transfer flavoprotein subunit alpha/FixB family protein [Candidatus Kariarchaeaceae archaeon]